VGFETTEEPENNFGVGDCSTGGDMMEGVTEVDDKVMSHPPREAPTWHLQSLIRKDNS
jgi:hypothetical protein